MLPGQWLPIAELRVRGVRLPERQCQHLCRCDRAGNTKGPTTPEHAQPPARPRRTTDLLHDHRLAAHLHLLIDGCLWRGTDPGFGLLGRRHCHHLPEGRGRRFALPVASGAIVLLGRDPEMARDFGRAEGGCHRGTNARCSIPSKQRCRRSSNRSIIIIPPQLCPSVLTPASAAAALATATVHTGFDGFGLTESVHALADDEAFVGKGRVGIATRLTLHGQAFANPVLALTRSWDSQTRALRPHRHREAHTANCP